MELVRGAASPHVPSEQASTEASTQNTVNKQPSMHSSSLTLSRLTPRSFEALNALQSQGDEKSKSLAKFAKDAVQGGFLRLSPNQQKTSVAQYGRSINGSVLVIQARLNELSQYDILSIGVRHASGEKKSLTLPEPICTPGKKQADTAESFFMEMSPEVKRLVMRDVLENENRRQAVYDLNALGVSNRHLKAVLMNDVLLKSDHDAHKKIIGTINRTSIEHLAQLAETRLFALASQGKRDACFDYIVDHAGDEFLMASLGYALDTLKPEQRSHFVKSNLEINCKDDPEMSSAMGGIIGGMGAGFHTIPEHHSEIVEAVLGLEDAGKAFAIRGLGAGLDTLDETSCDKLVQATLELEDEFDKSTAIRGLCDGLSSLTPKQRNAVFDAALLVRNEHRFRVAIVEGFSLRLHVLEPQQQLNFATAVLAMEDEEEKAHALHDVGGALKKVPGSKYVELLERLSQGALALAFEENRATAIGGLGRGLHLEPGLDDSMSEKHTQLIQQLIDGGLAMESERNKSHAIAGLGGGLQALTAEQKRDVLNIGLAMQDEANKSRTIAGLGAGLSALNSEQRERVLNACLAMADSEYKSEAIQGLGAGLAALTSEQRVKLTDAAVTLPDDDKWEAISALRNIKEPQQFLRLVDAALSMQADVSEDDIIDQLRALSKLASRNARADT